MARKSDGEKIDDLMVHVATHTERVSNIRKELDDLNRDLRESRQRLWLLVPPLVAAFLSAGLMAVVNFILTRR